MLEQLRTSQAWQDNINTDNTQASKLEKIASSIPGPSLPVEEVSALASSSISSVASLLSQLQSSPTWSSVTTPSATSLSPPANVPGPPVKGPGLPSILQSQANKFALEKQPDSQPHHATSTPSSARTQDLRSFTYQQSLSHIAELSDDPDFVELLSEVRFNSLSCCLICYCFMSTLTMIIQDETTTTGIRTTVVGREKFNSKETRGES